MCIRDRSRRKRNTTTAYSYILIELTERDGFGDAAGQEEETFSTASRRSEYREHKK